MVKSGRRWRTVSDLLDISDRTHNPKVRGLNPIPITNVMSRDICERFLATYYTLSWDALVGFLRFVRSSAPLLHIGFATCFTLSTLAPVVGMDWPLCPCSPRTKGVVAVSLQFSLLFQAQHLRYSRSTQHGVDSVK